MSWLFFSWVFITHVLNINLRHLYNKNAGISRDKTIDDKSWFIYERMCLLNFEDIYSLQSDVPTLPDKSIMATKDLLYNLLCPFVHTRFFSFATNWMLSPLLVSPWLNNLIFVWLFVLKKYISLCYGAKKSCQNPPNC